MQGVREKFGQLRALDDAYNNRSDFSALAPFLLDGNGDLFDEADKAVEFFWNIYCPKLISNRARAEPLSPQSEGLMLECLELLQKRYRDLVEYVPDNEDPDLSVRLSTYVHLVAARAFRIMQSDGISDEAEYCLNEVERVIEWEARETLTKTLGGIKVRDTSEAPIRTISMGAVAALAFMELCRVRRINGDYTGALHYLAKSAIYFDNTVRNDESTLSARFDKQEHSLDSYKREARLQSLLRDHLHDPALFRRH